MRSRPVEVELRLQPFEIPHSVAYRLENVAKRFLKFIEGWLEDELIGDDGNAHLKAASYRLWENRKTECIHEALILKLYKKF